ncbi:MAG: Hsp20/alpha crystallin family protein [Anaerolineales bacterium]|nr:Hsp20/alpha crystallin family protein [Anaerolineales bacterium]
MTAHRPHQTSSLDNSTLVEVLLTGGTGWLVGRSTHIWRPPTDVFETEDALVVQMEIAGMRRDDFYVAVQGQRLVIAGVRAQQPVTPRAYQQMEVSFGEFRVEVEIPARINREALAAEYADGFLRVTLPKLQPRRVDLR